MDLGPGPRLVWFWDSFTSGAMLDTSSIMYIHGKHWCGRDDLDHYLNQGLVILSVIETLRAPCFFICCCSICVQKVLIFYPRFARVPG
jgi:hypothetical protein